MTPIETGQRWFEKKYNGKFPVYWSLLVVETDYAEYHDSGPVHLVYSIADAGTYLIPEKHLKLFYTLDEPKNGDGDEP